MMEDDSTEVDAPVAVGDCVSVKGYYVTEPHRIVAKIVSIHRDDEDHDDDMLIALASGNYSDDDDHDGDHCHGPCQHSKIRGHLTEMDMENGFIYIMGTKIKVTGDKNHMEDLEVGDRARASIVPPDSLGNGDFLTGYKVKKWQGHFERVRGVVTEIVTNDADEFVGFVVLNTLVATTDHTKYNDDDEDHHDDDDDE
jgi:hypothetical protein